MVGVLAVAATSAFAQGSPFEPNLANVAAGTDGKALNRAAIATDKEGRPAIRFDERPGDGVVLWPDVEFSDGTIEFDARGKDVSMSFVGVAFHGLGEACLDSKPVPDQEPKVTERFRAMIQDALNGSMRADDYAPELWKQISPLQKDIQADLQRSGDLISLALIDRQVEGGQRSYRYLLEFQNARAVEHFVIEEHDKVALIQSEGSEAKAAAADRE
jgi:hypothetical protein